MTPLLRAYLVALLTVFVMAAVSLVLLRLNLRQESDSARNVHLGAIFRTKGLSIFKDVYALDSASSLDQGKRFRELTNDSADWRSIHQQLSSVKDPDAKFALAPGSRLNMCYGAVQDSVRALIGRGLQNLTPQQIHNSMNQIAAQEKSTTLCLDSLVNVLAFKSEHRSGSVELLEFCLSALTILLLAAECRWMLIPGVRRLHSQLEDLESEGAAAHEKNKLVLAENDKLRANQEMLQTTAGNLEATNKRIEAAAKRFEELFQGLPIACVGFDSAGKIVEWNRACERLFGDPTSLFGTPLRSVLGPVAGSQDVQVLLEGVFKGDGFTELPLEGAGQFAEKSFLCSAFPVHGSNDQVIGGILSLVDLTAHKQYERKIEEQLERINEYAKAIEQQKWELEEANERLASLASTDGLTGLFNHRSFQEALTRDVRRAERDLIPVSLIMMDIDNFKRYNDAHGHPAGDALLKHFGDLLIRTCRESDVIARYGGEEFAVILPSTEPDQAKMTAERLRTAILAEKWPVEPITVSFGVSTLSPAIANPAALIASADKALYAAKRAGKNTVRSYEGQTRSAA